MWSPIRFLFTSAKIYYVFSKDRLLTFKISSILADLFSIGQMSLSFAIYDVMFENEIRVCLEKCVL